MQLTILGSGDAFSSGARFNTCLHLVADGQVMVIDMGGTSMLAMRKADVDCNAIGTVLFTHFHGDHFAGLPFFLLGALFVSKRTTPLVIAGPRGVEARARALIAATYPGLFDWPRAFEISFREVSPGSAHVFGDIAVTAFPMVHDDTVGPCQGYRLAHGGRVLAFTGDTGWNDSLIPLAAGADLLVSECCYVNLDLPNHLSWKMLSARRKDLNAARLVITHMGPDMLAHDGPVDATRAFDGLVLDI